MCVSLTGYMIEYYKKKYVHILEPPVTVRLTETVMLGKELTPHASVCLSIKSCQYISFKTL